MKQTQYEAFETWTIDNFKGQWHVTFHDLKKYEVVFALASTIGKYPHDGLIVLRNLSDGALSFRYMESFYDSYGDLYNISLKGPEVIQELLDRKVKQKSGVLYWRQEVIQELIDELTQQREAASIS